MSDRVILEKKNVVWQFKSYLSLTSVLKKLSWGDDVTHYTMIAAVIWDFPIQKRFHHRQVSISERLQP